MLGLVAVIAVWVLLLGYGWSKTTGRPRERLAAIWWLLVVMAITLGLLAMFAAVPWAGSLVVPFCLLSFGAYAARLQESKATIRGINLRRNGPIWFVVGLMWLIVDIVWLLSGSLT